MTNMAAEKLLDEAATLIQGERAKNYGDARESFQRVAGLWTAFLGLEERPLAARDVALMLSLLKIGRQADQPLHEDNYLDGAGYIALAFQCHAQEEAGSHDSQV